MAPKNAASEGQDGRIVITPPNFQVLELKIRGMAPYMQARFSKKAQEAMEGKMAEGSTARTKRTRKARDFNEDMREALHISTEGWYGIPAAAFRNASIDVCRVAGMKMTHAKMSLFVLADGYDKVDRTPLVRLESNEPELSKLAVRNATGVADIRARPLWQEWTATLRVRYDADQFTATDVANLLWRAGQQVGVGEGRPFSKDSNGMGFGVFEIINENE